MKAVEFSICLRCSESELCEQHVYRDERLGNLRPMKKKNVICWSLSTAKDFHGELPAPSKAQKELVIAEACLWKKREEEAGKWERFRA